MQLHDFSSSLWSILPALTALTLAIVSKRVILSLSIGIIVGALMLAEGQPVETLSYVFHQVLSLVYDFEASRFDEAIQADNINIILFLFLLGVMTALLTLSGGRKAFTAWAEKRIKTQRGTSLLTVWLGIFIFIDDYFNSLTVGAVAQPLTDKFKISRAKLAYMLDSTAAPVCVMAPISSWGAYIITLVAGLMATHMISEYSPISVFMIMVSMNYYAIFALVLVFFVAYFALDIGPMALHEQKAQQRKVQFEQTEDVAHCGKVSALIMSIVLMVIATISMMLYSGYQVLLEEEKPFAVLGALENTAVAVSLVTGGVTGMLSASFYVFQTSKASLGDYWRSIILGLKSMVGAITILCFAWTINAVVGDMQTGKYLSTLVAENMSTAYLPCILFLISSAMAFATGTSWGTFGIMLPIAAGIAAHAEPALMLPCLSSVMAGAVFGDHCSPVSDTTILSSTGAGCCHIDHVTTQLPYALVVAFSSAIGFLVLGVTRSNLLGLLATAAVMIVVISVLRHKTQSLIKAAEP